MNKKLQVLWKRIIAVACASSMVLGSVISDIGVSRVQAAEAVAPAEGEVSLYSTTHDGEEADPRKIDVWDFGGKVETDTETYINNITPEALIASNAVNVKGGSGTTGTFVAGNFAFGDLTMVVNANDRLYTNVAALADYNYGSYASAQFKYDENYTAAGAWYCNGTGGASRRYVTISNVQAGDKIVTYMGIAQSGPSEMYFEGQGAASGQKDVLAVTAAVFEKAEFVAEKAGTYKIYENNAGKPMYHRIMRFPAVKVSGTIDLGGNAISDYTVKFVNQTTKQETTAELNGTEFTVNLAPGYTYTATLSGATGYGFTNASKNVTTTDAESLTGKTGVQLVVEEKKLLTYSGKIKGFADGYDLSKLKVTLVPDASSNADEVKVEIASDLSFTASLLAEVPYNITLSGVNDYEVKSDAVIKTSENFTADIEVGLKAMYAVTGGFIGLKDATVNSLTFTNVDDSYVYNATVSAEGYSINLRDGSYLATAGVEGYTTHTHVVVAGKEVNKDLMFVSTTAKEALTRVSDIYVGYPDKENNYSTVSEAMEACALMNPASEAERITVHIAPGTYREQIMVTAPYVSLVNDSGKEVLLTWYYGIGYKYYSADGSGFYNPENAYDQYEKKIAAKWGTAVYVKNSATGFRAQGITFENSFNRYLTDEELADGVECDTLKVERNYSTDVKTKAATERATAIVIEAANTEFKDCSFLSSQDTLYTAGNAYFKDCFIEGQTDYIFGSGNVVFDTCELRWKGYTANSLGGYITANRPVADTEKGYLFRNCVVTANKDAKSTVSSGYFGRPWGANAKVSFLNTKLESGNLITDAGWYEMSGAKPENANYFEYNTTLLDGTTVDTSKRVGGVMDATAAAAVKVSDYFGSWAPSFYQEEAAELAFEVKPFITDNGDLNTPYPGHTLTVGYSLGTANDTNDVSVIKWYRVKGEEETLIKTASAVNDRDYKIAKADIGYKIKVVVAPETISGKTAAAENCITEHEVLDGYEDPGATGGEAALGDGVNIFLAGDSTVKDYSASGINSGGSARNEGSWGEFLQSFFDEEKVTVVNYANGGRSSRSFINDGSLGKIAEKIGEGDYLFIQFGHNDCADGAAYLAERYVPLGTPDANGIYPSTPGEKVATPSELADKKYGSECYTYDCGGTYKWYLQQYIDVAKQAGAIPVLVTPVARMYYNADGTIKPHHDSSETSNNAYVTAVKQLAEEQKVLLIDGFGLTKDLFEEAYKAGSDATYGKQLMNTGDSTHNNKLGGMVEAAAIASVLQNTKVDEKPLNLAYAIKMPAKVMGVTTDGKTVFSVSADSKLVGYDILKGFAEETPYWNKTGQAMIDAIGVKAAELKKTEEGGNGEGENPGEGGTGDGGDEPVPPIVTEPGLHVTLLDGDSYQYTGSAVVPRILVTNNGEILTEGIDYAVKFTNNVKASVASTKKPTITVTGKGNLSGTAAATFEIAPAQITEAIVGDIYVASGSKATPVLFYNGVRLTSKDYTIADPAKKYTENGTMKITGKGNFTGEMELNVNVVAKGDLKKFTVTVGKEKLTYNGEARKPVITVVDAKTKTTLVENENYFIIYPENMVDAGTVKFTVIGMGIYSGSVSKSYKIGAIAAKTGMKVEGVNAEGYAFVSSGVTINEDLKVTYNNAELTYGKDYKVSYSANKKVGTAKYTVSFLGNYKGSKAVTGNFTIKPAGLKDAEVVLVNKVYNGKPGTYPSAPYVSVDHVLLKKADYTCTYYSDAELTKVISKSNPVSLGADETVKTIYVKIVGKGNYAPTDADDYVVAQYQVCANTYTDLSKAKVVVVDAKGSKLSKVEYTGEELKPAVKVYIGTTEIPADQFEVSYINNVNKGKGTIVINGLNDKYAGGKAATFTIAARNMKAISDLFKKLSSK